LTNPQNRLNEAKQKGSPKAVSLILISTCILSFSFFSIPLLSGEYLRGWDARTHIFFASSYTNGWWDAIEPRWYNGYYKFSYPPLSHQLLALFSMAFNDFEKSYQFLTWFFLGIAPLAVYQFSRIFTNEASSLAASLMFVFLPSVRLMVFGFGQFAGFVSLILLLFAVSDFSAYLKTGRTLNGFRSVCLVACSVASHHNTPIYLLPLILLAIILNESKHGNFRMILIRATTMLVACAIAALIVVFPFWLWLGNLEMQTSIPHFSRQSIFADSDAAYFLLFHMYGPLTLFLPLAYTWCVFHRSNVILLVTGLFFTIMGLGGTTKLPAIIYGDWWNWLTYERFGVWATIVALPIIGSFLITSRTAILRYLSTLATVLLIVTSFQWLHLPDSLRTTPPPIPLDEIIENFNKHPSCKERYLALGFGPQLPDLSTYTNANTVDGLWHTARTDPFLKQSGVGSLGDSLAWTGGAAVLEDFLIRAPIILGDCIIINETSMDAAQYARITSRSGWQKLEVVSENISVWTKDMHSHHSLYQSTIRLPNSIFGYIWGVAPLAFLFASIISTVVAVPAVKASKGSGRK